MDKLHCTIAVGKRVFTATRPDVDSAWKICYDEGSFLFHGTLAELRAQIRKVAQLFSAEKGTNDE